MVEQQAGRLRLGLLLLMATAMVKFEGMMLLGLWVILLLLDRDSRTAFGRRGALGWAGLLGLAAWLPYVVFRLHGPVPHPAIRLGEPVGDERGRGVSHSADDLGGHAVAPVFEQRFCRLGFAGQSTCGVARALDGLAVAGGPSDPGRGLGVRAVVGGGVVPGRAIALGDDFTFSWYFSVWRQWSAWFGVRRCNRLTPWP